MRPLRLPRCVNCISNGIPDNIAEAEGVGIGTSPTLRWVPLCKACSIFFKEMERLIETCEPLSPAEHVEFFRDVLKDFQVSGQDEEEEEGAPAMAVEPPALFPASATAPKALEAPKGLEAAVESIKAPAKAEKGSPNRIGPGGRGTHKSFPPDAQPGDYFLCPMCAPTYGWLGKGSIAAHTREKHPEVIHADVMEWQPPGPIKCPDAEGSGCKRTFHSLVSLSHHVRNKHPWFKSRETADV